MKDTCLAAGRWQHLHRHQCAAKSLGNASYSLSIIYQCCFCSVLQDYESLVLIATAFSGSGGGSGHRVHEECENGFLHEPSPYMGRLQCMEISPV